ncbi:hypothetical protein S7711_03786 [Stachybotrys chartarum IBT 7711]|uniref:AAA+ ATPase domain-containing protein n=1 Tax=Stachybotrys chartarum (strain CBS 109288 / IBT 7711) TaxID=1280523 RepID=A0A084AU67_STACB|nr:hypothetical protein S7711_03786 [Stachybotrys chartarum IBT 7711]
MARAMRQSIEAGTGQALALAKFFAEWKLPGASTLLSLATVLSFIFSQWSNVPALVAISSLWQPLTRRLTASVTLNADDRLTKEVIDWLAAKILWPRKARFWVAHSDRSEMEKMREQRRMYGPARRQQNDERNEKIFFTPANQSTWFIFQGHIFLVHQKAPYCPPTAYKATHEDEALQIICLGRSMAPIKDFLGTCRNFAGRQIESFVSIFTPSDGRWQEQNLQPVRPLETIHLEPEVKQNLIADICDYIDPGTRRFYAERGIPYRRGYLLHGPPGTGKTSLCIAIAGFIKLPLYILTISSLNRDQDLEFLFNCLPPKCLVLMEDIDAVRLERSNKRMSRRELRELADADEHPCTLSGLLNVLDGVGSHEGRVVIMTANTPKLLDKALIRPGRIDKKIYLGNMSPSSARAMFLRILGDGKAARDTSGRNTADEGKRTPLESESLLGDHKKEQVVVDAQELQELADEFSAAIPDETFTPAQIQEYLLKQRSNAREAASKALGWVTEEKARMQLEAMEEAEERRKQAAEDKGSRPEADLREVAGTEGNA